MVPTKTKKKKEFVSCTDYYELIVDNYGPITVFPPRLSNWLTWVG